MKNEISFPSLPLHEWETTKKTLHRYVQIVGKIRMQLTPRQNHWWHVPLYVNTRGIGTTSIPYKNHRFEINFDFLDHKLSVNTSRGDTKSFKLFDGLSVSVFYRSLFDILRSLEIEAPIKPRPYDLDTDTPFAKDKTHKSYKKEYVERYWKILTQVEHIFKLFNREYCGKVCPVQLYWHSFDLAVTRFSGNTAPPLSNANRVNKEAYSHEVISFGFWPGDENVREAAFYSYTFPAPESINQTRLKPDHAFWTDQNGSPLALLKYEDVRNSENPHETILQFLESSYRAGIETAQWDTHNLHRQQQVVRK